MCRKTLDQRDLVTKMDRIESNKEQTKFSVFSIKYCGKHYIPFFLLTLQTLFSHQAFKCP